MKAGKSAMIHTWERVLERRAEDIALIEAGQSKSYRFLELDALADVWLKRFAGKNLERKSIVLYMPNAADWVALLIALRRLNAVVIPVDASWPLQKAVEVAEQFRAALTISPSGIEEHTLPHRKWKSGCALVKLTSGSTGTPKGIVFNDDELIADGSNITESMGIVESDRNLCLHPLGHSYALGNVVIPLLAFGVSTVIGSSPFPRIIIQEAVNFGATVLPTVPSVLEALCKTETNSLGSIRLVVSAAARLTSELASAFFDQFNLHIHNFYGASETGGIAYDRSGKFGLSGVALGTPLVNVKLGTSKDGHLKVQSMAVSHYGKQADGGKPAEQVLPDLAKIALDGSVMLQGRADRVEKIAGRRIDLEATEQALIKAFSISRAAVFSENDIVQVIIEGQADQHAIKLWLSRRLGRRYGLRVINEIPLTARGKIDFGSLKARFKNS